jgi:hypothetical protein
MNTTDIVATTTHRIARPGFETTTRGRWISVAGAAYVASWITGLVVAPATPAATASDAEINSYYAHSGSEILFQSTLIHGIAGLAIAVLAFLVPAAAASTPRAGFAVRALGIGAALVSLTQVALAVVGVVTPATSDPATSASCFHALNLADTAKLMLLAGFATTVTVVATRARMVGSWTRRLTAALVVALPVGGLAFVVPNSVLTAVLYASLPLLLLWVGVTTWQVGQRAH